MKQAFPIVITPDGKDYVVYVPGLEINTEGRSIANAIEMAEDAIGLWCITTQDMGQQIPEISMGLPKVDENSIAQYALVDIDEYRLKSDMRSVRKNVTIPSYLNRMAEKANINFSQLLQSALRQQLGC